MALPIVTCNDMYLKLCEGSLEGFLSCEVMSLKVFQNKLAEQLCRYNPKKLLLKGDERFRNSTKVPRAMRPSAGSAVRCKQKVQDSVSKED